VPAPGTRKEPGTRRRQRWTGRASYPQTSNDARTPSRRGIRCVCRSRLWPRQHRSSMRSRGLHRGPSTPTSKASMSCSSPSTSSAPSFWSPRCRGPRPGTEGETTPSLIKRIVVALTVDRDWILVKTEFFLYAARTPAPRGSHLPPSQAPRGLGRATVGTVDRPASRPRCVTPKPWPRR